MYKITILFKKKYKRTIQLHPHSQKNYNIKNLNNIKFYKNNIFK